MTKFKVLMADSNPQMLSMMKEYFTAQENVSVFDTVTDGVSALEALRGLTVYGAYQYHEEGEKGSLAPGKTADLVLLSADPTAVEAEELRSVRVEATYKAGEKVYGA